MSLLLTLEEAKELFTNIGETNDSDIGEQSEDHPIEFCHFDDDFEDYDYAFCFAKHIYACFKHTGDSSVLELIRLFGMPSCTSEERLMDEIFCNPNHWELGKYDEEWQPILNVYSKHGFAYYQSDNMVEIY